MTLTQQVSWDDWGALTALLIIMALAGWGFVRFYWAEQQRGSDGDKPDRDEPDRHEPDSDKPDSDKADGDKPDSHEPDSHG